MRQLIFIILASFLYISVGASSINQSQMISSYGSPMPSVQPKEPQENLHPLLLAVKQNQLKTINALLSELPSTTDLSQLKDNLDRNLWHISAYSNNAYVFHQLMNRQKAFLQKEKGLNDLQVKEQMRKNLESQDAQGNTIAIMAAFSGNIEILKIMKEQNCNLAIENIKFQGPMHFAAQANQHLIITYLKELCNLHPSSSDDEGTTPLHQACFHGSYNVIMILLAWQVDVNVQDHHGNTPLHLCALKGQTKIMKKILYKGANKNLLDKKNLTPAQLALQHRNLETLNVLSDQSSGCEQTCIRMSFKPRKRSKSYLFLFIIFFLSSFIMTFFLTLPFVKYIAAIVVYFILTTLTFITYFWSSGADPGYINITHNKASLYNLLTQNYIDDICTECQIIRPFRSKHCEFCKRCVMVYDHHCPWIDNCVGAGNLGQFYLFLLSLLVYVIFSIWLTIQFIGSQIVYQKNLISWNMNSNAKIAQIILQVIVLILGFGFLTPLIYLIYQQTKNLLLDQTSFERLIVGRVQRGNSLLRNRMASRLSLKEKPSYSEMSLNNCMMMCCRNKTISRYNINTSLDLNESKL